MRLSSRGLRRKAIVTGGAGALTMFAATAFGQSVAPEQSAAQAGQIGEVVVTAQRRQEREQDVPISIEAFSPKELDSAVIQTVQDLNVISPGLNYGAVVGYAQPHLRGIGTTASGAGVENPVATYIDGVYYGAMTGSLLALVNIASIEIDKGPQGTLFGRNATGGLIQITTRTPSQTLSGSAGLAYGNYDTKSGTAYLTGGISSTLAADISAYYQDQGEGYGKNFYNGMDVNKNRDIAVRSKWLWTPSENTQVTLIGDYERTDDAPALAPATIPLGGLPFPVPPQSLNGVFQPFGTTSQDGISINVQHTFGDLQFSSISAWRQTHFLQSFDGALTPYPPLALNILIRQPDEQVTQEFQLRSANTHPVNWVTGIFYYQDNASEAPVQALGDLLFPLESTNTYPVERTYSIAGYGQATAEVLPATDLTLGLRYTFERKNFHTSGFLQFPDGSTIPESAPDQHLLYSKPTWRVALDHKLTSDLMVYVSYNRGFKSGGFNNELLPTSTYLPEILDAYETGIKSELFERRVLADAALFYYDYKNIQAVRYPAGLLEVYNGAAAEVYGLDLDLKAKLAYNFGVSVGAEFLHSKYTSFPVADYTTLLPDGGGTNFATAPATGNQLSQAPKATVDVTASYFVPVHFGTVGTDVTFYYNNGWFAEPDNRLRQPSYHLINAQLYLSMSDDRYRVKLWGRNLNNAAYAVSLASQANGDYIQYAPPRTYGVTVEAKF